MKIINLHNPVDNESFIGWGEREYITRLANEMRLAGEEDVLLSINTPGGSVFDGYNLLAAMDDAKGKVIARVEGLAASMGAYFLAYADEAEARETSRIMIHKAYTRYMPDDEEKRNEVQNELNIINSKMSKTFLDKGMNPDLVNEIFAEDNNKNYWFSAEEALEVGLIDKIIPSGKEARSIAASSEDLNKMVDKFAWWNTENINYSDIKNKGENNMFSDKEKLTELTNQVNELLNLKNEIEENVINYDEQLKELNSKFEKVESELSSVKNELEDIKKENESLKSATIENQTSYGNLVAELQNTVSDFKAPEIDDTTSADVKKAISPKAYRRNIMNEINQENKR